MVWKNAALLAMALLVVGCSSDSDKEQEPAELTDFEEEVRLDEQWSRNIGEGQGETFNMLVPAVDGETLFAADVTGVVKAIERTSGDVLWEQDLELPVSGAIGAGAGLVVVGTRLPSVAISMMVMVEVSSREATSDTSLTTPVTAQSGS